jgi:hypothetical protein
VIQISAPATPEGVAGATPPVPAAEVVVAPRAKLCFYCSQGVASTLCTCTDPCGVMDCCALPDTVRGYCGLPFYRAAYGFPIFEQGDQ